MPITGMRGTKRSHPGLYAGSRQAQFQDGNCSRALSRWLQLVVIVMVHTSSRMKPFDPSVLLIGMNQGAARQNNHPGSQITTSKLRPRLQSNFLPILFHI
eukprot:TRINITY_DN12925_c0_g1_i1.p1 TRINITY_DN12925_c0_g1~~TRINITY_DN12925_c0_g1_i1.p1  ORF type:complete len:100 (-),score=11.98 TRINITY_DN12925_c0_g1_i1:99-398(-)